MKANDLRKMTQDELKRKYRDFKEELFNLRFQLVAGQLTNTSQLKKVRRNIARVITLIREKELGLNAEKNA